MSELTDAEKARLDRRTDMTMTPQQHIEVAEQILEGIDHNFDDPSDPSQQDAINNLLLTAQVHATLAVAKGGAS